MNHNNGIKGDGKKPPSLMPGVRHRDNRNCADGEILCLINDVNYAWTKKGCTLSDKTAFEEFGLAQNDIKKAFWGSFDLTDSINSHTATRVLP